MRPDSPARRRFLTELMERADRTGGRVQTRKQLVDYSEPEIKEILAGLNRRHWVAGQDGVTIKVDALAEDAFGSLAEFRAETCRLLYRPQRDHRQEREETVSFLGGCLQTSGLSPTEMDAIAPDLERASHWLQRSLKNGRETTRRRLTLYAQFLGPLPLAREEPLRAYCARVLGDSHALDDDTLLRGALEKRLRTRHPEADDWTEAFLQEGILARLSNGSAIMSGSLGWGFGDQPADLQTFVDARVPFTLTEDAVEKGRPFPPIPPRAIFIENPSSWQLLKAHLADGTLLVLTDGVPNRATQHLAAQLSTVNVPLFHWGDIDAGGITVLQVLQRHGHIAPILMDETTLDRYKPVLRPLTPSKQASMERIEHPVLRHAITLKGWLEQEAIPIGDVVELLGSAANQ